MSREWKPGDVAICQSHSARVVKAEAHGQWWHPGYEVPQSLPDRAVRPLVVIDPENDEDVERLRLLYNVATIDDSVIRPLQVALREFADPKPPKPEEPMGLGAVVEDAKGCPWVRGDRLGVFCWTNGTEWRRWDEISAAHVVSEGVR